VRIAIGSDHAGFQLRQRLRDHLIDAGHDVSEYGPDTDAPIDYPDVAAPMAQAVVAGRRQLGILICSNGVGVSIAANKVRGARAALCADPWSARRAREHTDCNILALGSYVIGPVVAEEIVDAFVNASFEGGRHVRRLAKLAAIEHERDARGVVSQRESTEPAQTPS
jgi:ribose 5-phosphate isomerase B